MFNSFEGVSLITRCASQPAIPPVPPVSLTTPGVQAVFPGLPCIMGSAFPTARLTTTWTPTADVEVGRMFELLESKVKGQVGQFFCLTVFPQPATAPAPPAGVPQCPSAPPVLVGSSCTRASVWRRVGRGSTRRTTPATVIIFNFHLFQQAVVENRPFDPRCPCFQTAIHPVGPAWGRWPQTASSVSNQRKWCCPSPDSCSTVSARLGVPHTNTWMTRRHVEVGASTPF